MSYKPVSLSSLTDSSSSPSTSCSKHLDSLFSSSSADSEMEHYELYHKFDSLKMTNEHLSDEIVCKENDFSNLTINEKSNEIFDVEEGRQVEVIQNTDPSSTAVFNNQNQEDMNTTNGFSSSIPHNPINGSHHRSMRRTDAFVEITEQPASKALRFRYECEGRSAGSIPGVNSTPENKSFPSIRVVGHTGRAVVVVSCVTKDAPYKPHPHNLVGKEGCKKGVCTVEIKAEAMTVSFSNLGIQCVKKKDIDDALKAREEIRVDPFRTGFAHRLQPASIDLNAVRLCFQVFLEGDVKGRFTVPLQPVVSEPIYDKKAMCDLVICKLSDCTSSVAGGKEIILLCEKVAKEDISVRFYEERNGQVVWESLGDFQHSNVHKQVAISFRTPKYRTIDVENSVKVNIQLRRPSDGFTSEPLPFEFLPLDSEPQELRRKRQKSGGDPNIHLLRHLQGPQHDTPGPSIVYNNFDNGIKTEPRDTTPSPFGGKPLFGGSLQYRDTQTTPSPHCLSPSPSYFQQSPSPSPNFNNMQGFPQQQQQQLPSISPHQFVGYPTQNQFQPISPKHPTVPQNTQFDNQICYPNNLNILAPLDSTLSVGETIANNFNSTSASGVNAVDATMELPSGNNLSSLLDMDSQQLNINSGDLRDFSKFLNGMSDEDHMSDSLSRLMKN